MSTASLPVFSPHTKSPALVLGGVAAIGGRDLNHEELSSASAGRLGYLLRGVAPSFALRPEITLWASYISLATFIRSS